MEQAMMKEPEAANTLGLVGGGGGGSAQRPPRDLHSSQRGWRESREASRKASTTETIPLLLLIS
eukprot:scaffold1311_cov256-Pinguiococcus_pyrenoidosus.AAC.23